MQNKINFMISKGFSSNGDIYCVGGGNTYLIKDKLKELGFRYSDLFGWYSDTQLPVPAPYQLYHFTFDEIYQWEEHHNTAFLFADSKQKIKNKLQIFQNTSQHIGEIGDRLIELPVILLKVFHFDKNKKLYIFKNKENKIIWKTSKSLAVTAGSKYLLTAVVAAHEIYRSEKTTRVIRSILQDENKNSSIYFF